MCDIVRILLIHKDSPEEAFNKIRCSGDKEAAKMAISYCDQHSLNKVNDQLCALTHRQHNLSLDEDEAIADHW